MNMTGAEVRQLRQLRNLSQAKLAELSGVSQHILSAFELGKADLSEPLLDAVLLSLDDKGKVTAISMRSKRYQKHKYKEIERIPDRVARASQTPGNAEYRKILDEIWTLHKQKKVDNLSAISLFSGCGGFSLGFSAAGFSIKGFIEIDAKIREIYKSNFIGSIELGGDITEVSQERLLQFSKNLNEVDVVFGGPPCQGFSLSGKRESSDPRNTLFKHYLRSIDTIRPKIAVLENVRLLTSMKNLSGGYVKSDICEDFKNRGYKVQCFELNAKDYGVPQHRERAIFVAVRGDIDAFPTLPDHSHNRASSLFSPARHYRTFADACSDLPFIESGEQSNDTFHEAVNHPTHVIDWLWNVPEGRSAHDNEDPKERPPSGYNTTYKRQIWKEPAATVQTTFGMISGCRNVHPIATRSLTIREAARIQSFPDAYHFEGSLGTIRTGIGNAVPPLLAFQIATHIKTILSNKTKI